MKYTITIKDNATDEIIVDDQTDCIIGAIDLDDRIRGIILLQAKPLDVLQCVDKAMEVVQQTMKVIDSRMKEKKDEATIKKL